MRVGWSKMEIFASFARYVFRIFTSKATFIILCYVARQTDRIAANTVQRIASHGKKRDPENVGVAVGIFSLCTPELEICLGVFFPPPPLPANVAKTLPGQGLRRR